MCPAQGHREDSERDAIYEKSRVMRNQNFAYAKTKAQISCAVTAQLISAFVFATRIVIFLFYLNPKFSSFSCKGRFVSDLFGNPQDQFSHAHSSGCVTVTWEIHA